VRARAIPAALALFAGVALAGDAARAAAGAPVWRTLAWNAASGVHDGAANEARIAWTTEVHVAETSWMVVYFDDIELGHESFVVLRAANGDLRLDAASMKDYFNGSCILAGDRVQVELHVAARDRAVSVRVERVVAGNPGPEIATLCSGDDRVASNDNRVGRLTRVSGMTQTPWCTAWRIANGTLLTAGHCFDDDPPDRILDTNGFVEFDVPASTAGGTPVIAHVDDQYPLDATTVRWRFDGTGMGLGKDWAVFQVNRNANTRLVPHEAYGPSFRVTRELPPVDDTVRVTGFGTDGGTANQTNQTATGTFEGEVASGADIRLDHRVDTMPANSGSPIIWDFMNLAIGIHTSGGCDNTATSFNVGTSFEVDELENAINDFPGNDTIYADHLHPLRVAEEGTLFRPFATLPPAIAATPNGGIVSMYVGFYGLTSGTVLNRPMTLQAPAGGVVILGN